MSALELQPVPLRKHRRLRYSLRTLLVIVVVAMLVAIGSWFCVAVREARDAAIVCQSQSHLNQLQLALCNYHDMHGCFPPAYLTDTKGAPIHSWRVLILPFIEQKSLYDAYRFDEPWNGPNNVKLADRMPEIFHMPSEPASTAMTNIVVIVGPGTAFPGSKSTRIKDFADGLDNTILLTEIAASDIPWDRRINNCRELPRFGDVVPFRQQFVEENGHGGFEGGGDLAAGFVDAADDVDCGLQAGSGRGFAHQADHGVEGVEEHSLTCASDMGKEAAFDRVELRAVAGVVRHSDCDSQIVDEILQILLEEVLCRGIATAAVAQQEDRRGVRVASLTDAVPVPAETVARELAGVSWLKPMLR